MDTGAVASELRRLIGLLGVLALLLAPLLVVLWLGVGNAISHHPTRAVVVGVGWVFLVGYIVVGRQGAGGEADDHYRAV